MNFGPEYYHLRHGLNLTISSNIIRIIDINLDKLCFWIFFCKLLKDRRDKFTGSTIVSKKAKGKESLDKRNENLSQYEE